MSDTAGQTPDRSAMMTYREAASFLGVSVEHLRVMVNRGYFQVFPISDRYNAPRLLLREEVERYAAERAVTPEAASLLVDSLLWGVSDDGPGGVQMRQQVLAQMARLRKTAEGRDALAGLATGLGDMLEADPLINAASAAPERERLRQLHDALTGALAEPLEAEPKPEPIKRPRSTSRHAREPRASGADRLARAK